MEFHQNLLQPILKYIERKQSVMCYLEGVRAVGFFCPINCTIKARAINRTKILPTIIGLITNHAESRIIKFYVVSGPL